MFQMFDYYNKCVLGVEEVGRKGRENKCQGINGKVRGEFSQVSSVLTGLQRIKLRWS